MDTAAAANLCPQTVENAEEHLAEPRGAGRDAERGGEACGIEKRVVAALTHTANEQSPRPGLVGRARADELEDDCSIAAMLSREDDLLASDAERLEI